MACTDGNGARPRCSRLARRHWIFAAGEKRGGIAGERDQIGLGQLADQPFRFQGSQENIKGGTLAGEICQRNAEGRPAGEQCACSRKYWKARCTAARYLARVPDFRLRQHRVMPGRPPGWPVAIPAGPGGCRQAAYTGGKAPVPTIVGPEPIHPELATCGAGDLEKADLEHDLLRRSYRHRVHDSAAFLYHALGYLNGALGGDRIGGDATEHDLAVAAANADTSDCRCSRGPSAGDCRCPG